MLGFSTGPHRREFLRAGALTPLGLSLGGYLRAQSQQPAPPGKDGDTNCILLMLVGGPSQLDTFDPKPGAPAEVRGPFKAIPTKVPGLQLTEILPKTAGVADQFSVIRSMHHAATAVHDTGYQMMQSGRLFSGGIEHPNMGCVLGYLKGGRGELPPHVMIPKAIGRTGGNLPHGESAGYLGKRHDPLILNADPNTPDFKVPDLLPPEYLDKLRAERRQSLRSSIDSGLKAFEASPQAKQMDDTFAQAYRLMSSPAARAAFDLNKEPTAVRDRYGRTRFGQSCLLARRLVEAGVRFVTVNMFETVFDELTWDIHGSRPFTDINEMARAIAPNFDQAYSALLEDLTQRGLMRSTVVAATGEFGRTPKINPAGGRDHHPGVWSMLIGGGGIKGGRVIGESDELAYAPKTRPTAPGEVAATIYKALGLDPHQELAGPQGRPLPLVDFGVKPIGELF